MTLGFKPEFVPKILDGTKIHTLREDPHDRWKPGALIHMATGVRTKKYERFGLEKCVSTQVALLEITRVFENAVEVKIHIDGRCLSEDETAAFAVADGFDSVSDLAAFFIGPKTYKFEQALKLIHWTDKRY